MVVFSGHGICQWGRCVVVGERCVPWGYCLAHCKEYHKNHPKPGELKFLGAILVCEEKIS